jgi:hypothetical protein
VVKYDKPERYLTGPPRYPVKYVPDQIRKKLVLTEMVDHISRFSTRATAAFLSRVAMASAITPMLPFMAVVSAAKAMPLPFNLS